MDAANSTMKGVQIKMIILKNNFRKKLPVKYTPLKLLTILFFAAAAWNIALADSNSVDMQKTEILTTLEQRMLKKISIDFRNTPIEDVLRIMADQADVDIIKSPSVTGNVTATLTDVPLEEALNNILAAHGYGYVPGKNMIRVARLSEIASTAETLVSRIYRVTYADVTEVEASLKKFISESGDLSSNPGTSNIMVTDTESKIKAIDTFMEEIDRITPQILVEARIYDITITDSLDLGINWFAGTNTTYSDGSASSGKLTPFVSSGFSGNLDKASATESAVRFGILSSKVDLDIMFTAEQENICATLLANPRILVLDNQQATFKSINEIPYQRISDTDAGGQLTSVAFREVGVHLTVIPHVARDRMIRLRVKPEFNVVTGSTTIGGFENLLPEPIVDTREADTTLLIKDGQTVVLGGLRKKDLSQQTNKVPLLGDIPLVGLLFSFQAEETVTSELVVFITPKIIEQPILTETENEQLKKTDWCPPDICNTKISRCDE